MAKVSAHGSTIGTVYFTDHAKRYMSDGVILKNHTGAWKLHGKVKEGITPQAAYYNAIEYQRTWLAKRPMCAEYRRQLHNLTGMGNRWKLHLAVTLMPEDPDDVWSEACDGYGDNVHADIDEVCDLCRVYLSAVAEKSALKVTA